MKVLIAAGASGGHVYPALATASVLRDRGHAVELAGGDRLEARVVPEAGFPFHALVVRRPPSVRVELLTPRGIRSVASIVYGTFRARVLVRRLRPDVVLGMGGFAAVPVSLAAGFARAPLVLHEQNAHLSLAQRIPLRRADVLAIGFPIEEDVHHSRVELVGNPVRAAIAALASLDDGERSIRRRDAASRLALDPDRPTILVLGGSLGSGPLNELLPTLPLPDVAQILHVCGPAHEDATRAAWSRRSVRVVGFIDAIEDAYLASDVAVCRSGASVVSELALAGLASVLVPLPTLARGDQAANARVLERAGGAVVVQQSDAHFAELLATHVARLVGDADERRKMSDAARSIARPDAAELLADVVESVA